MRRGPSGAQRQARKLFSGPSPTTSTKTRLLSFNRTHSRVVIGLLNRPWEDIFTQRGWSITPYIKGVIHLVVCLTTGPKPLPKRALHIVRSRASSFKWEYPLLSLRSSNGFLRLLPCLPVTSTPLVSFLQLPVVEGSFYAKCDQSSSPSVYVFHVGYSSAPWL